MRSSSSGKKVGDDEAYLFCVGLELEGGILLKSIPTCLAGILPTSSTLIVTLCLGEDWGVTWTAISFLVWATPPLQSFHLREDGELRRSISKMSDCGRRSNQQRSAFFLHDLSSCSYVQMMCCLSYICKKTTSTVFEHPNHWILVENLCVLFVLYLSRFFHSRRECRKTCDSSLTAFRELLASCIVHACDITNWNVGFCGSHRPFNLHLQLPSQCFFLWLDKMQI